MADNFLTDYQKTLRQRLEVELHQLELDLARRKVERAYVLHESWSDEVEKKMARYDVIEAYRRLKFFRKTIVDEIIRLDNIRERYAQKEMKKLHELKP